MWCLLQKGRAWTCEGKSKENGFVWMKGGGVTVELRWELRCYDNLATGRLVGLDLDDVTAV